MHEHTVTCRPIARERLGKQARNQYETNSRGDPFLSNAHNSNTAIEPVLQEVSSVLVHIYPLLGNGCIFCAVVWPEAI
jgi:hypothetical protein